MVWVGISKNGSSWCKILENKNYTYGRNVEF